ncbi:hypothetical protein K1719_019723 [Acacia pycnantha]|nr:hypothetical protein K1719_019723 [Acacia pycnantha]
MAARILEVAQDVANTAPRSSHRRIFCLAVDIMVDTFYYNHQYSLAVEESMEDQHQALVPASKASVEELERVKIGGAEEKEGTSDCSICLEVFKADDEAICMPCNHMFHSSCIFNWLQRRNVCSLCRFELPPAVDDD